MTWCPSQYCWPPPRNTTTAAPHETTKSPSTLSAAGRSPLSPATSMGPLFGVFCHEAWVLAEPAHLPGGRFIHREWVAVAEGVEQGADVGGGFGGGVGDLDRGQRAAASGAGHAVSPQSAGFSCPRRAGRRPSVGWPSRTQYSSPPVISLTCLPWAASSIAPLVAALHDGPQQ